MKRLIYILTVILFLVGCRSSKHVTTTTPTGGGTGEVITLPGTDKAHTADAEYVTRVLRNKVNLPCITANVKVRLSGFGKDLSVNGSLRMKRDDVVRLSLRFFGMEVGLMEFTPQDVLIVDRFNKQYVRTSYAEVRFLRQAGLDFYTLQSLFWNELFVPGKHDAATEVSRFRLTKSSDRYTLTLTDTPKLSYTFTTLPSTASIESLNVQSTNAAEKAHVQCNYGGFMPFAGSHFPTEIDLRMSGFGKNLGLSLHLSSLKNENDWNTRTTVSSRYTRRSVDEVLKGLKF